MNAFNSGGSGLKRPPQGFPSPDRGATGFQFTPEKAFLPLKLCFVSKVNGLGDARNLVD